ncbi:MAG: methyltransferase domain-containing protein [Candidatus Hodarchaeota archaeon]
MNPKQELAERPDFDVYISGMNATVRMKWNDIEKYIIPGKIIDVGCGTGELTNIIAKKYHNSHVIGLDISNYFVQLSRKNTKDLKNVEIQQCDIVSKDFEPESITTKIFSSVIHELASYKGYNKEIPKKVLKNSFKELKPGGRIIIRDGVSPGDYEIYLWFNDKNGINELDHQKNKKLDFKDLSTEARFIRFCMQFKGKEWDYKTIRINAKKLYVMDAHFAHEFMSKKEYVENWDVEVLEEFGIFTIEEYKQIFKKVGFELVEIKTYKNPWIVKNWYKNKLELFKCENRKLKEVDYFPTNIVIVGEKPK